MARMWAQLMVYVVLGGAATSLRCPNGRTCEGFSTCCKLPGGDGYACCNRPQFMGASLRVLSADRSNEVAGVVCPDGTMCPAEYSCLHTLGASFACCPWEEAISCADGRHCCPPGSYCSADGQLCPQSDVLTPPAILGAVQCPDGESECPNDSTCCMMVSGSWGCCPMPEASCCADKIHCCPHGMTCDPARSLCFAASRQQPLRKKFPAKKQALALSLPQKNICPGNQTSCPDVATCCLLTSSRYGCCPLPNAVCCSDRIHCCPQGTQCDLAHSTCIMTLPWLGPITRLPADLQTTHDVQCDAKHSCPEGNTCCKKTSGTWGCCPLEEAVCCEDHQHCCPSGYTCNVMAQTCEKQWWPRPLDAVGPLSTPQAATSSRDVLCDEQHFCQHSQTCCKARSGGWACCPYNKGSCCRDGRRCCPPGFFCSQFACHSKQPLRWDNSTFSPRSIQAYLLL